MMSRLTRPNAGYSERATTREMMDPLFQLPVMPVPKRRPEDLVPFLDGWSPQGPDIFAPRVAGSFLSIVNHACRLDRMPPCARWVT